MSSIWFCDEQIKYNLFHPPALRSRTGGLPVIYEDVFYTSMSFGDAKIDPSLAEYIPRIEEMYNAPFVRYLGIELVSMTADEVRTRLELRPELLNSHGIGHGGTVYTLADHTFAFASNITKDATGQTSTINYYRPAIGKYIEAVSRRINSSKSFETFEVCVYSDAGKLVASGMFTAFNVRRD